jgi:MFS family permease
MAQNGDRVRDTGDRLGARFARLWAASTTSALGSGLALIAAPLYVASRTSSPLIVSGATGVAWLPWLLFALPGGVLVDRVDRRRLMVVIDWTRVAAMAVLARTPPGTAASPCCTRCCSSSTRARSCSARRARR